MWAKPKYASAKSNLMWELILKQICSWSRGHSWPGETKSCFWVMWWDAVESKDSSGEAARVYDMQNAVPEQRGWTVTYQWGLQMAQAISYRKEIAMASNIINEERTAIPLFPIRNTNLQEKIKSLKEEGRSTTPNPSKPPTFTMGTPPILPNTWPRKALGCHQSGAGCCRHQQAVCFHQYYKDACYSITSYTVFPVYQKTQLSHILLAGISQGSLPLFFSP